MKERPKHGKRPGFRPKNKPDGRRDDKRFDKRTEKRGDRPEKREEKRFEKREDKRPEKRHDKPWAKRGDRPAFKHDARPERKSREDRPPREPKHAGPRPNLYGFHAAREAWLNPARVIQALYLTPAGEAEFAATLQEAQAKQLRRPEPLGIEKDTLDRMLPRSAVHQGIAMQASPLDEVSLQDFIIKSSMQDKTILLMLDQVTDPHNVGAILRSASAFGAHGIIMQRKHAPELELALAKSASGAVEHIPVAYETNLSRTLEELKENNFFVFGLDERGKREVGDIMRNNTKPDQKIVLVLGAEGDGMRRLVRENCDELVRLPTKGAIQSLNVSNAAAVALYALLGR